MRRYPAVTDQTLRAAAEAVSGSEQAMTFARDPVVSGAPRSPKLRKPAMKSTLPRGPPAA